MVAVMSIRVFPNHDSKRARVRDIISKGWKLTQLDTTATLGPNNSRRTNYRCRFNEEEEF